MFRNFREFVSIHNKSMCSFLDELDIFSKYERFLLTFFAGNDMLNPVQKYRFLPMKCAGSHSDG